jgi:hypothetical protein
VLLRLLPLLLAVAGAAPLAQGQGEGGLDLALDDGAVRKVWKRLGRSGRADVAARFEAEVLGLDTHQLRLIARALELEPTDPGLLPEAGPLPFYDPALHAPDLPIERRRLAPSHARVKRAKKQLFARVPERRLQPAWRYDWGSGEVLRTGERSDPERTFANALAGYPPRAGLAQALIERALDDGSRRPALAAFGHAYTDREGGVYPFTIYAAWGSGEEIEMPDVDNLGIVHDLLGDWTRWKSPVPETQHDALYELVGELYEDAHRHRALRTALARSYVWGTEGAGDLEDGFELRATHLQALWLAAEEEPAKLLALLPAPERAEFFLADWGLEVEEDQDLRDAARARADDLTRDGRAVRELMVRLVLEKDLEARDD